ncbi:MAG: flagellar biosynthetic protein FliR [Hyphomonadaceae bacterium]
MTFWGLDVYAVFLLFARVGAMVMLLPGFGEAAIPARVRLAFALALTLALTPMLAPLMPHEPANLGVAMGALISEIAVGLMLGGVARMLMAALTTAGEVIGMETGLSFAQTADPSQGQAGQVIAIFLGVLGVALIFATDLHHALIAAVVGSYRVFTPGHLPDVADASELGLRAAGDSFRLGVQIAAPLMLAGVVFRVGLGVLSRLIPQIQVFFVAMPANVLGGFILLALVLSSGALVWLDRLERFTQTLQ